MFCTIKQHKESIRARYAELITVGILVWWSSVAMMDLFKFSGVI
ncbi:hypothetical protein VCR12J2_640193 [Vibrio coralliirubri]|nr:hypothetical protein VCR12J2_640193 [Vibrio coralliirubri]